MLNSVDLFSFEIEFTGIQEKGPGPNSRGVVYSTKLEQTAVV